ncbi:MAG TPA: hypothetical protein VHY08_16820 [Bacillota bacterium]|nr:hypothetical protein [Bacillota bacterium]
MRLMVVLILATALTGCWDLEEADYRAFITATGIDINPQKQVDFTAQIPFLQEMLPPVAPQRIRFLRPSGLYR